MGTPSKKKFTPNPDTKEVVRLIGEHILYTLIDMT